MAEKKKILIRIGSLRHGGAEKVLVTLLKNLSRDKYEIDLLLNLYSGKYLPEVPDWINIYYLNKGEMITSNHPKVLPKKIARVGYQLLLKKFPKLLYKTKLNNKKYDIEFAAIQGFRDEVLNSPNKSSKKIIWIHSDLKNTKNHHDTENTIQRFFDYDKILVISEEIYDYFRKKAKNNQQLKKIERIYNPLDTQEILEKANHSIRTDLFSKKIPVFFAIGTVYPAKGFDRLLKIHHQLLNNGYLHKIIIIGDGYDFENLQKLKTELGLEKTVQLLGFIDNPYPYFISADFFVLSSRYEGFPTVLFEAITLRKNIIATNVSGVKEMLKDGELGLIVDNSEAGLYNGMLQALQDPTSFNSYQEALARDEMPFSLEKSVHKIMTIIDEL